MGTAPTEDYAPIAKACDFSHAKVIASLGGGGSLILTVLALNQLGNNRDQFRHNVPLDLTLSSVSLLQN
ncbi:MAG: hypothetical protein WAK26_12510, partial [Terracidiphilus sp.]